jgi:hypothetical protein
MDQSGDDLYRRRLVAAFAATGLSVNELWLRYFALGGSAGAMEIEAYFTGLMRLDDDEHDLLAQTVNERLDEIAPPRAPYSFNADDPDNSAEDTG